METIKIKENVRGCRINEVELGYLNPTLRVTTDNGDSWTREIRIVFSLLVDGGITPAEFMAQQVTKAYEESSGEEQDYYAWCMAMVLFYDPDPLLDPRRSRGFDIRSLTASPTFQRIRKSPDGRGMTESSLIKKLAGQTTLGSSMLIERAIHLEPDLSLPFDWPNYENFRNHVLHEMLGAFPQVEAIAAKAVTDFTKTIKADKNLTVQQRAKQLQILHEVEQHAFKTVLPHLLQWASEREKQSSKRFADLVENAVQLLNRVAETALAEQIAVFQKDGATFTPAYLSCIERHLDMTAADNLLTRTFHRYEEVHGIIRKNHQGQSGIGSTPEEEPYSVLLEARQSSDIFLKWDALVSIVTELVNRNECIRLMLREAEGVLLKGLDWVYRQIYRKIRRLLTPAERRLFQLMYFRQPLFNGRIAIYDPVLRSFFFGMDGETTAMAVLVLAFKITHLDGTDLVAELQQRWRAYLRLYPYWLEIMREDEKEEYRQKTNRSRHCALRDFMSNQNDYPFALLQTIVPSSQNMVKSWLKEICTPTEERRLTAFLLDRQTETEIAGREGSSQQAVSKSIRRGLQRLNTFLRSKGYFFNGSRLCFSLRNSLIKKREEDRI